jgi:uncharacterized protein (DUF2141 family)
MKSSFSNCITAVTLFAALAMPLRLSAQERPTPQKNPLPLINQPLVPDARKPGGARFTLRVNGTGFVSSSVVNWNGSPRATTFVSGSRLKVSILASDIAKAHTASVTVVNPSPGGGTSNPGFFEVTIPSRSIGLSTSAFGAGLFPFSVATGDFNGDGKLDLAVADLGQGNGGVSVLLGNGDGRFKAAVNYGGPSSFSVAVGDFNGDRKPDLAVANSVDSTVSVLLGKGDGTFRAAMTYGAGSYPVSVAVGDFNGDGKLDIAVANLATNNVSILLGKGDGTFEGPVNYDTGTYPDCVAVGDFNGDGKLDLAVVNSSDGDVSILLGNGDGTFQTAVNYEVGSNPTPVAVGDFNGDGKLDLAVANSFDSTVSVLLGKGDGTFRAAVNYPTYPPGSQLASLAVGDFSRDGRLDIAVADYEPNNSVSVLVQISGPRATVSPTSLTFATQVLGTSSLGQPVTLSNYGSMALKIISITIEGADQGDFAQTNTCGKSVAVGASCTISVTFKPTRIGTRTAKLSIADNAPDSPQTVSLSGTGTEVELVPSSLEWRGCGNNCKPQTVTLTNVGNKTLSISSITTTGSDKFSQKNNCGSRVGAGKSCTITVSCTGGSGFGFGHVSVSDNGGGSPQTVALSFFQ